MPRSRAPRGQLEQGVCWEGGGASVECMWEGVYRQHKQRAQMIVAQRRGQGRSRGQGLDGGVSPPQTLSVISTSSDRTIIGVSHSWLVTWAPCGCIQDSVPYGVLCWLYTLDWPPPYAALYGEGSEELSKVRWGEVAEATKQMP